MVTEHSRPFDPSMVSQLQPFWGPEYFLLGFADEYRNQWLLQVLQLAQLCLERPEETPSLLPFLASITHPEELMAAVSPKIDVTSIKDTISLIHQRLGPHVVKALKHVSVPSTWSSPSSSLSLLSSILYILDDTPLTPSIAETVLKLVSDELPSLILSDALLSSHLLSTVVSSLQLLDRLNINPFIPISKDNYLNVAHFAQNKMRLYSVSTSDSIESFAVEIALLLEQLNAFEKQYRKELEAEEDYLDATDVPDIESRYLSNRQSRQNLSTVMHDVSLSATRIFSEERLQGLVSKLTGISSDLKKLESFESIAVLISRLKNTIGISTGAFLSLSSPLIPLWSTLVGRYSGGISGTPTVTQIDGASPLFSLYCQSYTFYLSTRISDSDFFSSEKFVTLAQNREMVDFFKRVVWTRCAQRFNFPMPETFVSFMKSFNMLLLQLQSRNYLRTWTKTDDLLLTELRAANLSNPSHVSHAIAHYCPMLIPMLEKVKLFTTWVSQDRNEHQPEEGWGQNQIVINIHRGPLLLPDSFQKLMPLHSRLKEKLKVQFFSEDGTPEPGIDGGGLFRELFTEVMKLAFSPDFGLFSTSEQHTLYPNPHSNLLVDESIRKFQFLGQLLGKCLYEGLLVDLPFAFFFLNILQGHTNSVRELASYDRMLYQSMQQLLDMPNIDEVGLTFEFGETGSDGAQHVVELLEGGSTLPVTAKNVVSYVQLIADLRLNKHIRTQAQAFMRGLADVIQLKWLRLFTPPELSLVIAGGGRLDVEDLRQNVEFAGGFYEQHPTVQLLWEVLEEMTNEEQQAFLRFVTSVSRPPILGFAALKPKLCIRQNQAGVTFLPTANTCINLLKMPSYPSKTILREKLLYAINSGARFELS